MAPTEFHIIAIDHSFQDTPNAAVSQALLPGQVKHRDLIASFLAAGAVDLICEESHPLRLSITQGLAFKNKPPVRWVNIVMTAQERLEAGIYEALQNRPSDLVELPPGQFRQIEHRIPEDAVRENFMARKTIWASEKHAAKKGLVLCGDMHADSLKEILKSNGYHAGICRDLIAQKFWK